MFETGFTDGATQPDHLTPTSPTQSDRGMRCESGIRLSIALAVSVGAAGLFAQTPQAPAAKPPQTAPPPQTTPMKPTQPAGTTGRPGSRTPPDARLTLTVMVTASDGRTLPGRRGAGFGSGRARGRNRFVRPGHVLQHGGRHVSAALRPQGVRAVRKGSHPCHRSGAAVQRDADRRSPPPPAPKPDVPAPAPPPVPDGNYSTNTVSIPDFIEKNYIGSAPVKNSPVGCTAATTTTLVQTKDPVKEHTHADADEIIHVVAGEGTLHVGGRESPLAAATVAVVPRGTAHSLTRRGSRPLIFVSTLAGPPCQSGK